MLHSSYFSLKSIFAPYFLEKSHPDNNGVFIPGTIKQGNVSCSPSTSINNSTCFNIFLLLTPVIPTTVKFVCGISGILPGYSFLTVSYKSSDIMVPCAPLSTQHFKVF